jgi:hypothetical protein
VIRRALTLTFAALSVLAAGADAHDRGSSYSSWTIEGRTARVALRFAELDLSRFDWAAGGVSEAEISSHSIAGLRLFAGDAPCEPAVRPRRLATEEGTIAFDWSLRCPADGALEIRDDFLFDVAPSHLHFARVTRDGSAPLERLLSERDRRWALAEESRIGTSLGGYLVLGIEHILTGTAHLAFLIALLLVAASVREVAGVVTGFTAAHSITLALAVLGTVRPAPAAIEALIGLSIALVGAENLWLADRRGRALPLGVSVVLAVLALCAAGGIGRVPALTLAGLALFSCCYFVLAARVGSPQRLRWGVAFLFGLLHGFGFATVLTEARLPVERLVHALFGFNAGVEVGQLAVVALVWPLLRVARRPPIADLCSAAVVALGVFWFVIRAYG